MLFRADTISHVVCACKSNRRTLASQLMRHSSWLRLFFVAAVCLVSLPWLAPCSLIEGVVETVDGVATRVVRGVEHATPRSQDYDFLPRNLRRLVTQPGPVLKVQSGEISPHNLTRDTDFNISGARARHASRPFTLASARDLRQRLVLCEQPYVLLFGENISFIEAPKGASQTRTLQIACASRVAKITVITPDGTFFGLAERIHFHAPLQEVILEGNPTVQSGHQHIKSDKPDALMRLNFVSRTVTLEGKAKETRF